MTPPHYRYPAPSELSGLVRRVAPRQVLTLLTGPILIHRVDAPVRIPGAIRLTSFARVVRDLIPRDTTIEADSLRAQLGISNAVLRAVLSELQAHGLIETEPDRPSALRAAAADVLATGPVAVSSRGEFYFAELGNERDPLFLALNHPPVQRYVPAGEWRFDPNTLRRCFERPEEWKRTYGFPVDWRWRADERRPASERIFIDEALRLSAALVETGSDADAEPEWQLFAWNSADGPSGVWQFVASLPADAARILVDALHVSPNAADWQSAWQAECERRGISARGHELRQGNAGLELVPLTDSAAAHPASSEDEMWLVAGTSPLRSAVRVMPATNPPRQ